VLCVKSYDLQLSTFNGDLVSVSVLVLGILHSIFLLNYKIQYSIQHHPMAMAIAIGNSITQLGDCSALIMVVVEV
jgi:hypothetical protein